MEILRISLADVAEFLRIPVDQGEPRALYLDHDPVAFEKRVQNVRKFKFHIAYLSGDEGFRLFKTVAEFSTNHVAAD